MEKEGQNGGEDFELEIRKHCRNEGINECEYDHSVIKTLNWIYVRCEDMTFYRLKRRIENGKYKENNKDSE